MKQDEIRAFLKRYFNDAKKQADKMKTDKGKLNKYEKLYQNLQQYFELMNSENIEYAENKYKSLVEKFKKVKDDSKVDNSSDHTNKKSSTAIVKSNCESLKTSSLSISSDWNISISFGNSSSQNFDRALYLAKQAPKYSEEEYNDKIVYQATYGKDEDQYLAFIQLYELIQSWKSTDVFINGKLIDRKIIGGLNYCYGDRCRSRNPDFCYGASFMTKNPFGCHRLQISACNHPWWSFSTALGNCYFINKDEIRKRIEEYSKNYKLCPCFDENKIKEVVDSLPSRLTLEEYNKIRNNSSLVQTIEIKVQSETAVSSKNITDSLTSNKQNQTTALSRLSDDRTSENHQLTKNTNSQKVKSISASGGCILPIISIMIIIICIFFA